MKRLSMVVPALLFCATVCLAQKPASRKEPFIVKIEQLSKYLQLTLSQREEVASINEFFIEQQNASLRAGARWQEKKMKEAIYGNLKLMKRTLTPEQYRKYVVLLNMTNNNNRLIGINTLPDVYLADNN